MSERRVGQTPGWAPTLWLQSHGLVEETDLTIWSPDGTLGEIAPLLEEIVGIDLETGVDVRGLKAVIGSNNSERIGQRKGTGSPAMGGNRVVVGSEPGLVFAELMQFSVVEVAASLPADQSPPNRSPAATVGLHGFSGIVAAPETSFSIQMIDDWGIEDVLASALDVASRRDLPLAVLFDLAVLDPAFDRPRTIPGGLDMRRLLRAARAAGRRPDVSAAGFVKAGSDLNLVHALLSFCAGLAGR